MTDVGFVHYKKGDEPETWIAKWCQSDYESGTFITTEGPADGLKGRTGNSISQAVSQLVN